MKIIIKGLCLVWFSVATLHLQAQRTGLSPGRERPQIGVVYGSVTDDFTKEAIQFATITLISKRDSSAVTGGITDEKGRFRIVEIPVGMYSVEVNFIGYKIQVLSGVKLSPKESVERDLGEIFLEPASTMIEDVEVVAGKELMRLEIDKRVFDVSQNITSTGGSANEVLENIPSVEVDIDGNVSLRGSQNVTVLIDGKPSGLTGSSRQAVLDQLPASSIEFVEIITNPSAKYDPDGMGGIINIILKKNKLFGYSGNVSLTAATGDNYNGSFSVSKRNDKLNIFANYGFRYADRFSERKTDRITYDDTSYTELIQDGKGSREKISHNLGLGTELYLSSKSTLYVNGTYQIKESNDEDRNDFLIFSDINDLSSKEEYFRENTEKDSGNNIDLNLGYELSFIPRQKVLSVDFSYSNNSSDEVGIFNEFENTGRTFDYIERNDIGGGFQFYSGQLDYIDRIGEKWKLETGVKSTQRTVRSDFRAFTNSSVSEGLLLDTSRSNDFEYKETIMAGYAIVGRSLGKVGVQLGLRAEQALTDSYLVTTDSLFENDYFSLFPSGHLKYQLSQEKELMLSYSRRINRPRTRQLNPFTDFSNPLLIRVGNPFLLPEYVDAIEASYSFRAKAFQLMTSVYYKQVNGVMSRLVSLEDEVSTVSYQNLNNSVNQGLEVIFTWKKWEKWNVMLSGNAYKTASDGSNVDSDLSNEGYAGNANANITYKNKGWQAQASARYRSPFVILQGEIQSIFFSDLALKKSILKEKGSLGLRVSDMFDSREFNFETSGVNFAQKGRRKRESRNVYLSFSYNFGKLENKKKRNRGVSGSEEMDGIDL
ncbi:MAG: iron complex outermembrane receptor protein [Flavobacteriales bacterium]|jgi:iron complex outermembrane receptor protein